MDTFPLVLEWTMREVSWVKYKQVPIGWEVMLTRGIRHCIDRIWATWRFWRKRTSLPRGRSLRRGRRWWGLRRIEGEVTAKYPTQNRLGKGYQEGKGVARIFCLLVIWPHKSVFIDIDNIFCLGQRLFSDIGAHTVEHVWKEMVHGERRSMLWSISGSQLFNLVMLLSALGCSSVWLTLIIYLFVS